MVKPNICFIKSKHYFVSPLFMNIGHLEGLRIKTSKNIREVGSQGCYCALVFFINFRSRKCTKMGGKVDMGV